MDLDLPVMTFKRSDIDVYHCTCIIKPWRTSTLFVNHVVDRVTSLDNDTKLMAQSL